MFRNGFVAGRTMMGGFGLGAILLWLLWVAIVVLVVVLVVRLVRHRGHMHGPMMTHGMQHGDMGTMTPPAASQLDEAVVIARKRFAAGEITKEQFDEMMKTLG
jgi:uncharacterized membrane protein